MSDCRCVWCRLGRWFARGFERVLTRLFDRHDIGRANDLYLTRWDVRGNRYGPGGKLFVRRFHRSDSEEALHDHPWPFWSLILAGGYWEHTPGGRVWYGPGSLLRRPAEWRHRVELPAGATCWTLIWTGEKVRSWGFGGALLAVYGNADGTLDCWQAGNPKMRGVSPEEA